MTTKRKPYVRPMTSTVEKTAVLSLLYAARRHSGAGSLVQY